jgi:preprotein translocase subunit SecG
MSKNKLDSESAALASVPPKLATESSRIKQKHFFGGDGFKKVLRITGKVVLYTLFGLLILAVMVIADTMKDASKQNNRK